MHLHFDPVGGIAGDMFIAAMLHAFPEHVEGMFAAIRQAGLPSQVGLRVIEHNDKAMSGLRFGILEPPEAQHDHVHQHDHEDHAHAHDHHDDHHQHDEHCGHDHDHDHHQHAHRHYADIRAQLHAGALAPEVLRHACGIFDLIAQAEAKIHAVSLEDVAFHEVGAFDSIADVVGAAYLIASAGATSYSCAPIPSGSGFVRTAHGKLPVPVPATALLLQGFETFDDGLKGERVTPTGAAIMRYLSPASSRGTAPRRLLRVGSGFGSSTFPGISNVLRVLVFDSADASKMTQSVAVIEFEVDDQSGEDLAVGLERLRSVNGVLDVLQAPAFGKKGRMLTQVRVLAQPDQRHAVLDACFGETTTIGLRCQLVERITLAREQRDIAVGAQRVAAKVVLRPGVGASMKPESDAIASAGDAAQRAERRHQVEHAWRQQAQEDQQKK